MIRIAVRAMAVIAVVLVLAATVWPAVSAAPLPAAAALAWPLRGLILLLAAALALHATSETLSRRAGLAVAIAAALVVASWGVGLLLGPPLPGSWLWHRPGSLATLGSLLLGVSLWRAEGLVSLLAAIAGGALVFLLALGHLYDAAVLVGSTGRMAAQPDAPLGVALLLALALAVLALHDEGPVAAYAGSDAGAHARRRLLPAAVLTPVASGFLLLYAITGAGLSPTLAVTLTVFANVLVMLLLIDRAGSKVAAVAEQQKERLKAREAAARRQGLKDAMTALMNRRGWDEAVVQAERQCRAERLDACVVVIDLDDLKRVNDAEGHAAGDGYILRAAHALRTVARQGDALARMGGDEFAYLLLDCDDTAARAVVGRFQDALRAKRVSASVGYAMRGTRTIATAFDEADQAMYQSKRARKKRPLAASS